MQCGTVLRRPSALAQAAKGKVAANVGSIAICHMVCSSLRFLMISRRTILSRPRHTRRVETIGHVAGEGAVRPPAGGAGWWFEALHERLARNVFASDHHFADDTPVPVLDPGRGAPRRDGCGSMPASNARVEGRSRRPPSICSRRTANLNVRSRISSGLSGVLHVDGYAGFEPLAEKGDAVELAWSDPLPARRPHRVGHEPRRARDSTGCFLEGRIISLRAATAAAVDGQCSVR
jgi:Transposase IS66 family